MRPERVGGVGAVTAITVSLLTVGCATPNSVVYTPVNQASRTMQRRSPESIDVLLGKPPSRPHTEIGLFEVYQGHLDNGGGRSTEEMFYTLRLYSALRGCDAVQVLGVEMSGGNVRYRIVRAACDIYIDDEALHAPHTVFPAKEMPGEGKACAAADDNMSPYSPCPDPWICQNQVCVSPYR